MFIYIPNSETEEALKVTIFLPYTKIQPATLISLIGYEYTPVKTLTKFGYSAYFKKRWKEAQTFINIEQDIVVYPGAIQALWDCPRDWCVYDFHLPNHQTRNLEKETIGVPLGCVKISAKAISKTSAIWQEPIHWEICDQHLTKQLLAQKIKPHQHRPGVVNANPAFLAGIKFKIT